MIRVENEGGVSIQDSSFDDCRLWNGSGCVLSSSNGWVRFDDVSFRDSSSIDNFYIQSDGDLGVLDCEFEDLNMNPSSSENFIYHKGGDLIVSSTSFNSSDGGFISIKSDSSLDSLIRNLEFVNDVNQIDVLNQVQCGTGQYFWGDEVSINHPSETFKVCDLTGNCENDNKGMTCECLAPTTGDPTTGECVSPPGQITVVPNPILLGSFLKPFSGNGSVFLINVGGNPVEYQIYEVEEYCERANSSSSFLFSKPNLTNYDELCSNVN